MLASAAAPVPLAAASEAVTSLAAATALPAVAGTGLVSTILNLSPAMLHVLSVVNKEMRNTKSYNTHGNGLHSAFAQLQYSVGQKPPPDTAFLEAEFRPTDILLNDNSREAYDFRHHFLSLYFKYKHAAHTLHILEDWQAGGIDLSLDELFTAYRAGAEIVGGSDFTNFKKLQENFEKYGYHTTAELYEKLIPNCREEMREAQAVAAKLTPTQLRTLLSGPDLKDTYFEKALTEITARKDIGRIARQQGRAQARLEKIYKKFPDLRYAWKDGMEEIRQQIAERIIAGENMPTLKEYAQSAVEQLPKAENKAALPAPTTSAPEDQSHHHYTLQTRSQITDYEPQGRIKPIAHGLEPHPL